MKLWPRFRFSLCALFLMLFVSAPAWAQVVISANQFPTAVGDSFVLFTNRDSVAVSFDPNGSSWDFSTGPQSDTEVAVYVPCSRAPQPDSFPLAQLFSYSFVLRDPASAFFSYGNKTTDSLCDYGFSSPDTGHGGYIAFRRLPDRLVYLFPLQAGVSWTATDSVSVPISSYRLVSYDTIYGRVLKEGTVTSPVGGPYPCLLLRMSQRGLSRLQPANQVVDTVYQEIAEWLVPDLGVVVHIASSVKDSSWPFTRATCFPRLWKHFLVGVEESSPSRLTPNASRLTVSPNPFISYTTIPGHSSDRFTLYDISGRKVGTYKGDRIGQGLSSGVYFLRQENNDTKPLRIVKLK